MAASRSNSSYHAGDADTRQSPRTHQRLAPPTVHKPPDNVDAYDPASLACTQPPADDPFGHPFAATGTSFFCTDNNDTDFSIPDPHSHWNYEFTDLLRGMSIPHNHQAFPDDSAHMTPYVEDPDVEAFVWDMEHGLDAIEAMIDSQPADHTYKQPAGYQSIGNHAPLVQNVPIPGRAIDPNSDVMTATANERDIPYNWSADIGFDTPIPLCDALTSPLDTNGPLLPTDYEGANPFQEEKELDSDASALKNSQDENARQHPTPQAAGQGVHVPSPHRSEDDGIALEVLLEIDDHDRNEWLLDCLYNAGQEEMPIAAPLSWPWQLANEAILPDSPSSPMPSTSRHLSQGPNGHYHPQYLSEGMEAPHLPSPPPFMAAPPHMASSHSPSLQVAPPLPFTPSHSPPLMAAPPQVNPSFPQPPQNGQPPRPPQVAPPLLSTPSSLPPHIAARPRTRPFYPQPPQVAPSGLPAFTTSRPQTRPPQVAPSSHPPPPQAVPSFPLNMSRPPLVAARPRMNPVYPQPRQAPPHSVQLIAPRPPRMATLPLMEPHCPPPQGAPPLLPLAPHLPPPTIVPPQMAPPHSPPTHRRRGRPPIGGDNIDESRPPPNLRSLRP